MSVYVLAAATVLIFYAAPSWSKESDEAKSSSAKHSVSGARAANWTPAAMADAKTASLPRVNSTALRAVGRARAGRSATPGGTEPTASDPRANGEAWLPTGKLFYRAPDGDFVCSAQFIAPRAVLVAAHCVRNSDTGAWFEDLVFALQDTNGNYAAVYDYDCVATKNGWVQPGFEKFLYDYALIRVDKPTVTGHFGTKWGWQDGFDRAFIVSSATDHPPFGPVALDGGVAKLTHGGTGSATGGAWVEADSGDAGSPGSYVVGLSSFGFDDEPGAEYGPYLDEDFRSLLDYVENGCEEPS